MQEGPESESSPSDEAGLSLNLFTIHAWLQVVVVEEVAKKRRCKEESIASKV